MTDKRDEEVAAEAAPEGGEGGEGAVSASGEVAVRAAGIASQASETAEQGLAAPGRLPALSRAVRRAASSVRPSLPRRSALSRPSVRGTRGAARQGATWLAAQVLVMAPRIKARNRTELRKQFPGRDVEDIADALVDGAARATAAAGGAAGLAAVLPVLPAFPAEIAAETLVVVGIEIKLIAELHEIYGVPVDGGVSQRMGAYVAAWAQRRGVSVIPGGLAFAAGSPIGKLLRRRLTARAGRSAVALGPLLTGAAAGAYLNSRETRRLGQQIRRDLRARVR